MRIDMDRTPHQAAGGNPLVHTWCDVCRTFDTDPRGGCPSCQPSPTGDLVGDLLAQRQAPPVRPVTDDRLHAAGLLTADDS